jgi:hypothetical protein
MHFLHAQSFVTKFVHNITREGDTVHSRSTRLVRQQARTYLHIHPQSHAQVYTLTSTYTHTSSLHIEVAKAARQSRSSFNVCSLATSGPRFVSHQREEHGEDIAQCLLFGDERSTIRLATTRRSPEKTVSIELSPDRQIASVNSSVGRQSRNGGGGGYVIWNQIACHRRIVNNTGQYRRRSPLSRGDNRTPALR